MNDIQKQTLLKVAKDTVDAAVAGRPVHEPTTDDPELLAEVGCFVTLKNGEQLLMFPEGTRTKDGSLGDMMVAQDSDGRRASGFWQVDANIIYEQDKS